MDGAPGSLQNSEVPKAGSRGSVEIVRQAVIDPIGLEAGEPFPYECVKIAGSLHQPRREVGCQLHPPSVAVPHGDADHDLAATAGVWMRGVESVAPPASAAVRIRRTAWVTSISAGLAVCSGSRVASQP